MAVSNRERIERVMDALRDGLGPFVIREYKTVFKRDFAGEVDAALTTRSFELPRDAFDDEPTLISSIDTQGWLNLMWRRWNEVFHDKLGHTARSYVSEMIEARNQWAHQRAFTNDEAYRVADTASRLLKAVGAADQAAGVDEIGRDLLRLRFEDEAKKAKKTAPLETQELTTQTGLQPWRAVVEPHPDVASGRYIQAEFAADLAQVLDGTAAEEYQNPVEFFRRTYLTEGLLAMLTTGVKRLTAQGGDPIVQLKTSFGGGKTHSMLALYHMAGRNFNINDFPGGEYLVEQIGDVDLPEPNRAVLVGTAFSATDPTPHEDITTHTLWGEMAYQIGLEAGGRQQEAYQIVEKADLSGANPGSDKLLELLDGFGPCLIIIDELVAYARNLYGVSERLPGGSYESVMSFVQSITEAVRRSTDSMLLVALPESEIEFGGEAGRETLEMLAHTIGRIESVWKPVTATESFEIVRRRLFSSQIDYAARDAVIDAFSSMYHNDSGEYPSGVADQDYRERMRGAYPIHPELFDRLYQDWSTLERFQRTRGVLRLMAAVIHELWTRGDQSLMIMPGTVPLDATPVRNELLRYLPDTWTAVYDTDIDGPESLPAKIDGEVPNLGRHGATRRVARCIFIGSAPSVAEQALRGLEESRIRLACSQPGEPTAVFGDALRRMANQLMYLYTDGSRYWYDTRPTVNRLARDLAQRFEDAEVDQEIIARLRKVPRTRDFAAFHVAPLDTSDVVDEARVRVVVLPPGWTHKRSNGNTYAIEKAYELLESRGTAQRLYKNMLVFIAPDENASEALYQAVRECMAWGSIQNQEEELNLDAQQRRQVRESSAKTDETVNSRLREAYSWLLTPIQPDPMGPIELQANRIGGDDNFYERAARKLHNDGLLIGQWSPDILRMELDRYMWNEENGFTIGLKQLWEYLAQYCYLPRLFDQEVLIQAVRDGASRLDPAFAYSTGIDENGFHTGLVFGTLGTIYLDDRSILVHPDYVSLPPERKPIVEDVEDEDYLDEPSPKLTTRYYGHVQIDPQRVNKDVGQIVDEVIGHLTSLVGSQVEVSLEISARHTEGFDESTIRTVNENSSALKFDQYGFEEA